MKRNTFFYLFNIIVPCAMLSLLTLMTFWLPPTSGEKVGVLRERERDREREGERVRERVRERE